MHQKRLRTTEVDDTVPLHALTDAFHFRNTVPLHALTDAFHFKQTPLFISGTKTSFHHFENPSPIADDVTCGTLPK